MFRGQGQFAVYLLGFVFEELICCVFCFCVFHSSRWYLLSWIPNQILTIFCNSPYFSFRKCMHRLRFTYNDMKSTANLNSYIGHWLEKLQRHSAWVWTVGTKIHRNIIFIRFWWSSLIFRMYLVSNYLFVRTYHQTNIHHHHNCCIPQCHH